MPHDLAVEIKALIPDSFEIPSFLVEANCTVRGLLSDGTLDPACFKTCSGNPFLIVSWQDVVAWWLCELNVGVCRDMGGLTKKFGFFQDMTSSLSYFADVLDFASQDGDFVRAHRLCAIFSLYHLIFAIMMAMFIILIFPSACLAIVEILSASLELVMEASGAENT